ncbi:2-amino-4-hydroxy-6-hydroxymethyldihydropteridine diphosphokinase [Robertmurraya kyonggiensis]|uniref:2-amino-4-hydroxy-6-hydroxymethyldihydropteridine diphosphokinase n=1 Tax=Robertmurraya kyonggiensis TaxID=1037680 RepID=A0A4U1D0J5_9BACI|nr:2-amino-4-hydroxy-6-hydroxymethyldihydropteridine diphosphokinase [Robertmurraya kyonggiensis]TKC13920.1 2-amino-4-hydroxy-6-hydroxymethyldihydropteridine diphosphokinase [Robertmurraya kyonggiensis]
MMNRAFLAIGTNIGDRYQNIDDCLTLLHEHPHIELVRASSIYETDPVGYTEQDPFLNMVIEVKTALAPSELLDSCLEIEHSLGRKRIIRWGPRVIDLDILLYNQENIETDKLFVPHPRMQERAFVLIPLLEISPNEKLPRTNQPLRKCLDKISDREGVRIWKQKNGEDVFALFAN